MFVFIFAVCLIALVEGQGGPPGGGAGGPPEQECVLFITSPVYVCEDDLSKSYMSTDKVETVRFNETLSFVTGAVEMLKAFDPSTLIELILFKFTNGKKEMMFTHEIKLCDELGNEDGEFWELLKYLGFPTECPIEVGSYPINDLVADLKDLPINSANIGPYEAVMNFWKCEDGDECKERTFECCVKLDCEIEALE